MSGRRSGGRRRARYGVRNWAAYERGLARRGDITVWVSPDAGASWRAPAGRRTFSDAAIAAMLMVRAVFRLALRQVEGLIASILAHVARDGRAVWEPATSYGRCNAAAWTFARLKRGLGTGLRSRRLDAQRAEAGMAARVLNRMAALGMRRAQRVGNYGTSTAHGSPVAAARIPSIPGCAARSWTGDVGLRSISRLSSSGRP